MKMWEALKHIQENGPSDDDFGICFNTRELQGDHSIAYNLIAEAAPNWIDCTQDKGYPVPECVKEDRYGPLWDNPKRHEFLNFLIDYFKMLDK